MNRFAVFGNPIDHSLSPMIHNEFSKELGIELSYEKILSPIDEFEFTANEFIEGWRLRFQHHASFKVEAFNFSEELTLMPVQRCCQHNKSRKQSNYW